MARIFIFYVLMVFIEITAIAAPSRTILVFGDSLSAGYGLNAADAWPNILSSKLPEGWKVVNASQSGETTQGGLTRLSQTLQTHHPDWVLIELGANDGLRGLDLNAAERNLATMIEQCTKSGANVLLISMRLPPNFGRRYTEQFAAMYLTLSKRYHLASPPFLLEGIADHPELFQADQLHPVKSAQPRLASNVWQTLAPIIKKDHKR